MKYKYTDPYEYGKFHDELIQYIYKHFTRGELIDCYTLYKLYIKILTDYNNHKLDYDWRKKIDNLNDKIQKEKMKAKKLVNEENK